MLEILFKGGIIMPFIILCSVIATVIIVERLLYFRKIKVDEDKMISRLKATLLKGHFDEALSICETNPSPITNLMKVGIEYRQYDTRTIKEMVQDAANMEVPKLERFLSALGTCANLAPLLGLLGTVLGNIQSFGVLGANLGAVGDPTTLARGIAEALITTAAGIIVAIPAIIFYNHLVSKVNHIIIRLENRVNELVLLLGGKKSAL
ncbi:MAG: MotA/TolQ/ExbB proton channel family protein [Spirochaetales bacterium]|nr:MotA/TolQ/ExbB proton channel family protein [Spirochaetales bacterium]